MTFMKILLINPPRTYFQGSKGVRLGLPLGLMYIAAVLEENGCAVKIFDSLISEKTEIIEKDNFLYHGVSEDYFKDVVSREEPALVGIGGPFSAQIHNAVRAADLVKQINPNIFVVIGGPHASVKGADFLKENKNIDAAVVGEGELAMLELAKAIKDKRSLKAISNVVYRFSDNQEREEKIFTNPWTVIKKIDELPLPAYHLMDMERYFFLSYDLSARPTKYNRSISMITSRGCPYNCVFCSIHLHMGRIWRFHSVEYVVNHIERVISDYKVKHISFEDDNFTFNPRRCERILDEVLTKKIKFSWDTPNGVRVDTLNEKLLKKMKKSGCQELIIGTESGSQEVLDKIINKNLRLENVFKIAQLCRKIKIKLRSFFVIGFPGETKKDIQKTIDFAFALYKEYRVRPNLMIATPLFGTRLYEISQKENFLVKNITSKDLALATQARGFGLIETSDFTPEDLKKFARELEAKISRLDLIRKLSNPKEYFKILKLIFKKPDRVIHYLKRILN